MGNGTTHTKVSGGTLLDVQTSITTGLFWRCFFGFVLYQAGILLLNNVYFPQIIFASPYIRDISQVTTLPMLILMFVLSRYRPNVLNPKYLNCFFVFCIVAASALLVVGLFRHDKAIVMGATILLSLCRSWPSLGLACAFSCLDLRKASVCLALALPSAYLLFFFLDTRPLHIVLGLYLMIPLALIALTRPEAFCVFNQTRTSESSSELSVTRPFSVIPLVSRFFITIFAFQFAFGYSLHLGEVDAVPIPAGAAIIPLIVILIWTLIDKKLSYADYFIKLLALLVIAGFVLAAIPLSDFVWLASVTLACGSIGFKFFEWKVVTAAGSKNHAGAISLFCLMFFVNNIGSLCGAAVATGVSTLFLKSVNSLVFSTLLILLVFTGFMLFGFQGFSFYKTIENIEAGNENTPMPTTQNLENKLQKIAQDYALTNRETQVFVLLAKGRNGSFIEKELSISRNTVKAHVKHIYRKLDIHSHQELISLVEGVSM